MRLVPWITSVALAWSISAQQRPAVVSWDALLTQPDRPWQVHSEWPAQLVSFLRQAALITP